MGDYGMAAQYANPRVRELTLQVDNREKRLLPLMPQVAANYKARTGHDLRWEVATLDYGDARWVIHAPGAENHGAVFGPGAVEHKTAPDAHNSMTGKRDYADGAYEHFSEQAGRMSELGIPNGNTYWIIDGVFDPAEYRGGMQAKNLVSKQACMLLDGRNIVQAQSPIHTILALVYMHDALEHVDEKRAREKKIDYLSHLNWVGKKADVRSNYLFHQEMGGCMGMSMEKLRMVCEKYPTRADLYRAYAAAGSPFAAKRLLWKDETLAGIGKKTSEDVYTWSKFEEVQAALTGAPPPLPDNLPTEPPSSIGPPPPKKPKLSRAGGTARGLGGRPSQPPLEVPADDFADGLEDY